MVTIIIGAGIVGLSTAYYLTERGSNTDSESIHIVEFSSELFASASGYAGGYLERGQFPRNSAALGDLSFALHAKLAEEHNGAKNWGYSRTIRMALDQDWASREVEDTAVQQRVNCFEAGSFANAEASKTGPTWLKQSFHNGLIALGEGNTAQVNPRRLCAFLLDTIRSRGVHLHHPASVTSVATSSDGHPTYATITSSDGQHTCLPCTRLVLAAGAWTPRVLAQLFPQSKIHLPISPLAGHSIVFHSPAWQAGDEDARKGGAHSLFTAGDAHGSYQAEIFARADGELYLAGVNSRSIPLPPTPTDRVLDPASLQALRQTAERLCGAKMRPVAAAADGTAAGGLQLRREGLCFRPVTPLGRPVIDKLDLTGHGDASSAAGVWVGVGHGPWGIALGPGTGCALSEMLEGRPLSADVAANRLSEFASVY